MTDALVSAYKMANSKLLMLDYDGVLAPIVDRPEQAMPAPEVLKVLQQLAAQTGVKIVIISGRDRKTLEGWLGMLPVDMSAEHGHFYKESGAWRAALEADMTWRADVEAVMQQLVSDFPGSHIELKQASLVWHYRQVRVPIDAAAVRQRLEQAARGRAVCMPGKRVMDVRAPGTDKGQAARHWYERGSWDFVLCIGDDVTDEAMFTALPESAWTIKVGSGQTSARLRFEHQVEVVALLNHLADIGGSQSS